MDYDKCNNYPYLTTDLTGIGGVIKSRPEDFFVEEIPQYEFSGEGTHLYLQMEKKNITTLDALTVIGSALKLPRKKIGYAGLKDARAITRQWISVEHIEPEQLRQVELKNIKFLDFNRHGNKLRIGHLAGNRFIVRVRQLGTDMEQAVQRAKGILKVLEQKGAPNYFGPQRFGMRGDSQLLGGAIVSRRREEFVDLFLGRPDPAESQVIQEARSLYEEGKYEQALEAWPRRHHDQRRALRFLIKSKGQKIRSYHAVDNHLKLFFVSAFQGYLFNQVVAKRMPDLDQLLEGDMAYKHENGACFRVENPEAEQSRCAAFEISPSGPLFGYRLTSATGPAGEIEAAILTENRLTLEDFRRLNPLKIKGARRPLRFRPRNTSVSAGEDDLGSFVQLEFELDPGCYATCLIREITRSNGRKSYQLGHSNAGGA